MIRITSVTVGELAVNCYIVTDEATGKTAVIDPGKFTVGLDAAVKAAGYDNLEYILLTHGHFDHIAGVEQLQKKSGGKVKTAIGKLDAPLLSDARANLSVMFFGTPITCAPADILLEDGDEITLGESTFKVINTPGHTAGSVCFVCGSDIFSGDTLFRRSAGRTDFPTGSINALMRSLSRLAALPGSYAVHPGHDSETTLDEERKANPYLSADHGYNFI